MSHPINWHQRGGSSLFNFAGYVAWLASAIAFMVGVTELIGIDSVETQAFVALCVLVAEVFSLRSFIRERSYRSLFVIVALLGWSLAFVSNSLGLIGNGVYGALVAGFIGSVIFIKSRK